MSGAALCRVTRGPLKASNVQRVDLPTDRLLGDEKHCATLRLELEVEVVSDYLHIGRGTEPVVTGRALELLKRARSIDEMMNIIESIASALGGVRQVKRMYALRGKPAIPGSSLKGAVRSRIELGSYGGGGVVPAEMLYGNEQPLVQLPPVGQHGWRHARIWCESVFEPRSYEPYSVLDDLMGVMPHGGEAIASRIYFSDLLPAGPAETRILLLDHGEMVEAVPRGARFRGEILATHVSLEELGLLFYGLGLDKRLLCNRESLLLLGASKYRDRILVRECRVESGRMECRDAGERPVRLGIVRVSIGSVSYAPWSRCRFGEGEELARKALEAAKTAYPGLRICFDEVERRLKLSGGGTP